MGEGEKRGDRQREMSEKQDTDMKKDWKRVLEQEEKRRKMMEIKKPIF